MNILSVNHGKMEHNSTQLVITIALPYVKTDFDTCILLPLLLLGIIAALVSGWAIWTGQLSKGMPPSTATSWSSISDLCLFAVITDS